MRRRLSGIIGWLRDRVERQATEMIVESGNVGYPAYVTTDIQTLRWDLSMMIAQELEKRETGGGEEMVLYATRSIYRSDITLKELADHPYIVI